ncbi:MAG: hypothetical protein AAF217_09045 [Pseudomonadota bacterium]
MSQKQTSFFVGYLPVPGNLRKFLLMISVAIVAGLSAGGILAGISQDDPGQANFRFDLGRQTVTGTFQSKPYPIVHVDQGSEHIKTGRSIMVTRGGKRGVNPMDRIEDGSNVEVTGILLKRGELDMFQLVGGNRGLKTLDGSSGLPVKEDLGTWRVQGEICDGKCLAGAMNPGRGIAHKACANLCLIGNIPPVFVSSQPIEDEIYFLVGDNVGGPMSSSAYDYVGQFVEMETQIVRQGDILIMQIKPDTLRAVQ